MKNKENILNNMMNKDLFSCCELKTFQKGELILHQGQTLEYLYILIEGRIKACHTTPNGHTTLCAFSHPLSIIGELEFLNHLDVLNNIYALEKTTCYEINVNKYQNLLLNDILFMRFLAQSISLKLYHSNHNSAISMNYPVENRLASYLISCQDHMFIQDNFVSIAEMIGCSYRQLQRVLNDFCKLNYLTKIKKGHYRITNSEALKKLGQDLYHL